jgi:alpha-ketoglutarate-dependent taurine dioxygenase
MKLTQPIEFPGLENLIENIAIYKQQFVEESILVFRNANLSYDDQSYLHDELGKTFDYYANTVENNQIAKYIENHSERDLIETAQSNDILLPWHIEHLYAANPKVMSTWNMTKFTTDSENGKTYFIDSQEAYNSMPEEWKIFLSVCKINNPNLETDENLDDFSPVVDHWITGNKLLRFAPRKNKNSGSTLKTVYDREPTELEKTLFEEIFTWFGNYVYDNEEERIVHKWQQGDLLIVDIFKLVHAVTGGFNPADREFIGMWGFKNPTTSSVHRTIGI